MENKNQNNIESVDFNHDELLEEFWSIMKQKNYSFGNEILASDFWPVLDKLREKYEIDYCDDFERKFNFILNFDFSFNLSNLLDFLINIGYDYHDNSDLPKSLVVAGLAYSEYKDKEYLSKEDFQEYLKDAIMVLEKYGYIIIDK